MVDIKLDTYNYHGDNKGNHITVNNSIILKII